MYYPLSLDSMYIFFLALYIVNICYRYCWVERLFKRMNSILYLQESTELVPYISNAYTLLLEILPLFTNHFTFTKKSLLWCCSHR